MIIAAAICSLLGLSILGGALITRMNEFKELNDYTEYQLQTGDYYKLSDFNITQGDVPPPLQAAGSNKLSQRRVTIPR